MPAVNATDALGPAEAERFREQGFLHVPGCLDEREVAALRAAVDSVLAAPRGKDIPLAPSGVVRKIAYVFDKHPLFLQMLAHPRIMGTALALSPAPDELVVTWEDMLVKPPLVGAEVTVHQDLALQCVRGGVFSLGIHIDDARANPVWFLPGSHRLGPLTRDEVRRVRRERAAEFRAVPAAAGDIVVHDVLTAHFSEANTAPTARHTWYLEFRVASQLLRDGPWSAEWVRRRQALLVHSHRIRGRLGLPRLLPPLAASDALAPFLHAPRLRMPHVVDGVEYDTSSEYNHFG